MSVEEIDLKSETEKPDTEAPAGNLTAAELLDRALKAKEEEIIPWDDAQLPSEGEYYSAFTDGMVQVRPMSIHAEKMMATQRFAKSGKSIDMLFKQCCQLPEEFDTLDLLAGDRVFLLYFIRGITHGNIYEFTLECPHEGCNDTNTYSYDLNDLYETVQGPAFDLGDEPFKVVLPHMSKIFGQEFWVKVRFMRGRDMQKMLQRQQFDRKMRGGRINHKMDSVDQTLEENINIVIEDVMGDRDRIKIQQIVKKLHALDTSAIREFLRKNSPGIDTNVKLDCPSCGELISIDLPITESFFRPTVQ